MLGYIIIVLKDEEGGGGEKLQIQDINSLSRTCESGTSSAFVVPSSSPCQEFRT